MSERVQLGLEVRSERALQTGALKLASEVVDGVLLIHVSGPLDSATYDQFKAFMDPVVAQPQLVIVLDCRNLTYVNSHAWTLLMHYHRWAMQGLSNFKIAAFNSRLMKGIQRLGLGNYLAMSPTVEDALHPALAV